MREQRSIIITAVIGSILVAALWLFPRFWYTKSAPGEFVWLTQNTNISGWTYLETPVAKSQEAVLDADQTDCGEFTNGRDTVQGFAAKRFADDPNEIGLFVHTPDRCWTESGWKFKTVSPDTVELNLHGANVVLERRVFVWKSGEEVLVYFGGLSAGRALPYRLDHNLSIGIKQQLNAASTAVGAKSRAVDARFWGRIWDSFKTRQINSGPKLFIRVSSPVKGNIDEADARLKLILAQWLQPGNFQAESETWRLQKSQKSKKDPHPNSGETNR